MSRKTQLALTTLALTLLVSGCSSVGSLMESKKIDYKSASKSELPTLEVPPDLTTPARDGRYSVPNVGAGKGTATLSAYSSEKSGVVRAASNEVLPQVDKVRIERAGGQRWLVIGVAPEKLWPVVKEFWQETGFVVNVEIPDAGIMETDWAEDRAKIPQDGIRSLMGKVLDGMYSTAERDKFRTRLEKGTEPGTSEIYISHRGMLEVYTTEGKDQTRWQPRPADPELEAEMLRRLMVRLGTEEVRAKTLIAGVQGPDLAKMQRAADGSAKLEVAEAFDRTWRRVGLALDRVGFTVEDRDRAKGLYFVRYVDPEQDSKKKDDGSWLAKLKFWGNDKSPMAGDKAQYRIHVSGTGEASTVTVLSREGGADTSETARKILGLLLEQLK